MSLFVVDTNQDFSLLDADGKESKKKNSLTSKVNFQKDKELG